MYVYNAFYLEYLYRYISSCLFLFYVYNTPEKLSSMYLNRSSSIRNTTVNFSLFILFDVRVCVYVDYDFRLFTNKDESFEKKYELGVI